MRMEGIAGKGSLSETAANKTAVNLLLDLPLSVPVTLFGAALYLFYDHKRMITSGLHPESISEVPLIDAKLNIVGRGIKKNRFPDIHISEGFLIKNILIEIYRPLIG